MDLEAELKKPTDVLYVDYKIREGTDYESHCATQKSNAIFYGLVAMPFAVLFGGVAGIVIVVLAVILYRRSCNRERDEAIANRNAMYEELRRRGRIK